MKLAMMRRTAHHTSGDTKPLIPVHENALSGAATSVAPRFKRSSDTNTHTTLNPSCSQGLPKPGGRFCIFYSSSPLLCRAKSRHLLLWAGEARKRNKSRDSPTSLGMTTMKQRRVSQLIRVRKSLQDGIMPRRPEVFDHTAEDR